MDRQKESFQKQGNQDRDHRDNEVTPSLPSFRFVELERHRAHGNRFTELAARHEDESQEVINKFDFVANEGKTNERATPKSPPAVSPWIPVVLRPVPAFYPLEKSSRLVDGELNNVTARLSECMRLLSVQAIYNNDTATAYLLTPENVEMHLSLWKTNGVSENNSIVVELQRRKGDSIVFHRYSRYILDAAVDDFNSRAHLEAYGADLDVVYSKKVQRLLKLEMGKSSTEQENAIIAIEIAHGLLMKDRMDARQLGLESLCLLTDPKKTGFSTAVIASHVVLLGTANLVEPLQDEGLLFDEAPFQQIREVILSLVQFSRIGEDDCANATGASGDVDFEDSQFGDSEQMSLLHNLALAVLANALDVVEKGDVYDNDPEDTDKKPAAVNNKTPSEITDAFMQESKDISSQEILSALIQELGKAGRNPHNACLSARCLGSLCSASKKARKRAKELGAKNVVSTALHVGTRTHLKLETECKKVTETLRKFAEEE